MPFNGDSFTREQSWVNNDTLGIKIRADLMDEDTNDIAYGLSSVAARITALATGPFTGYVSATPLNEPQTAIAGQTVFTLTTFAYTPSVANAISVYVDGIKLPASDVTQTSSTSVTVATAMVGGEQVELVSGGFSSIMGGKVAAQHTTTTNNDFASYQFRRNVEYAGGTPGFVNSCIRVDSFVDNAGATAFEWAFTSVMHNNAAAGENVAGYLQGIKNSTGPTWGGVIEVIDNTGANPTTGALALEIDVNGNGTDNNNARIGIDIAIRRPNNAGTAMEAAYGIRFQNSGDTSTKLKTAIGFLTGMSVGIGIDLSPAVIAGAAIKLAQGQTVQWETSDTPAVVRQMSYNGAGLLLANTAGTTYWSWNDDGSLVVQGVQLLGARQTVTGSRGGNAALASLLAKLALHGLIVDNTTA